MKRFFTSIINWFRSLFRDNTFRLPALPERFKVGGTPSSEKERKVLPRKPKDCLYPYCRVGAPMMVSVGQIAFTHRECRTDFRQMLRKALKRGR